ncbi:MAG: hypothetical protein RIB32_03545 [Phycisphaerales bacterium]
MKVIRALSRLLPVLVCLMPGVAAADIGPENVLLLWNSEQPDSQAVRDAYVARHPGVREFDLDDGTIPFGTIGRNGYNNRILAPLRDFINGVTTGEDISSEIMVIVTTRGIPGRINGDDEMELFSTWCSLESELSLLQQDLESSQGVTPFLPSRTSGPIDNPYHLFNSGVPIENFNRSQIKTPRNWVAVNGPGGAQMFRVQGMTPGNYYLVCRLDAAPTDVGESTEITAVEHVINMLDRSQNLIIGKCDVQALLDEFGAANQLDDDGFSPLYPARDDFGLTAAELSSNGWDVTHDETNNFVFQAELADPLKPLIVFGSYGENHDIGAGEDPPGEGVYAESYLYHPGCVFVSYESFNGESIVTGLPRGGQQQALDFISAGGTFTIPTVKEPFTFPQADLEFFVVNFYERGFTFAEAAYMAMPALSWQSVPIGDPLARAQVFDTINPDLTADGLVDPRDLYAYFAAPLDVNCDNEVDENDAYDMRDAVRRNESTTVVNRD